MRLNKKGFSYIEVILVIAMLVALGAVGVGSFSTLFNARASSAVSNLEAMMSQSKINSLSGDPNFLRVVFKDDPMEPGKEAYFAELYHTVKKPDNTVELVCYKDQKLGNKQLSIYVQNGDVVTNVDRTNFIEVQFNERTGAVKYAGIWPAASHPITPSQISAKSAATPNEITIHVKFANDYVITLWKLTGEHFSEKG